MIERNKHPDGPGANWIHGACLVADGLIRILSFGRLHTTWVVDNARRTAKRRPWDGQPVARRRSATHPVALPAADN